MTASPRRVQRLESVAEGTDEGGALEWLEGPRWKVANRSLTDCVRVELETCSSGRIRGWVGQIPGRSPLGVIGSRPVPPARFSISFLAL